MTLSASKIETASRCTASLVLPQTEEKRASQAAGVSAHAVLGTAIEAGEVPDVLEQRWPGYTWRSEVAFVIDIATGEARELGAGINRAYPTDLGPFAIPGTADLIGCGPAGELVVVDKKSFDPSVSRAGVNGQLHTLALMACRALGDTTCEVAIWHELRPLDVSTVEPWDLTTYARELRELLEESARARAEYRRTGLVVARPGKHCRWCSAFANCPAQNALMTRVSSGTIGASIEAVSLQEDDEAARFYQLSLDLGMLLKRMRERLEARASENPIPLADGLVYGPRPVNGVRRIDGDKAYDLIRETYGQAVADQAVTRDATQVSIKAAFKSAGIAPEPETKKLMKALEAAGAITQKDSVKVESYLPRKQLKAVGE